MQFHKNIIFILVVAQFFVYQNAQTQKLFKHVESNIGLQNLKENNGVSVADFDGDYDLDVFVVSVWKDETGNQTTQSKLFRNNGNGSFTDVTFGSGLENLLPTEDLDATYDNFLGLKGYKFGAFWGDYDNDGDPDIFFTYLSKVQLFENIGDGKFQEVTDKAGITKINDCENTGAVWFDYDNDSFLDLYVVDWKGCNTNTLYHNNGNGTFTNVTASTNIITQIDLPGYTPFPFDFNNDGFLDLYITNDLRKQNQLFINNNGQSFTEAATNYGLEANFNDMGIAIGDYDKDGYFDFYVTTIANNSLLKGNENNTYTNVAEDLLINNTNFSWGTKFGDFDLDGDEDLIVVNGFKNSSEVEYNNLFFENKTVDNEVVFSTTQITGIEDLTVSVEVLDFDYDFDGDLDLIVTNSDRNTYFYENTTRDASNFNLTKWFQLSLEGTISNRDAIGTKITLITDKDTYVRYYSGVGFLGQSLKPVHFGLDDATKINQLIINWPSGHVDTYSNLELNTFGKAIENDSYAKLNIQPAIKVSGCTDVNSCNYNPQATIDDGSCKYLEVADEISGNTTPAYFSTETYSFRTSNGVDISWQVDAGEILSGQGTSEIIVQWQFQTEGKVSLVLASESCKSQEVTKAITLSLQNLAENKSIARIWNEALLEAIRGDFARPTIHARNLFHVSVAMFDAWAIYSDKATPYLMGKNVNDFTSNLNDFTPNESIETSRKKAISYAAYRVLSYRFKNSPSHNTTQQKLNDLMSQLNFDINYTDVNYEDGNAAALGNYIAETIISYGNQDGSNELANFENKFYETVNNPLVPETPGNLEISDPNRWQTLSLDTYIDQSGNLIEGDVIDFLSPEWGAVASFSLQNEDKKVISKNNNNYTLYHDISAPPLLNENDLISSSHYKNGFTQVAIWGSHLDPNDNVMWDISPKSIGNLSSNDFPDSYSNYDNFYKRFLGGDSSEGHNTNPITNEIYESQVVPRGDYTRVLAEFWADGPDSETPPGHWFTILNEVNDHDLLVKKIAGEGEELSHLEWDVKSYFVLGGAMHDAAIAAWSLKGYYDYIRPISAIRYLADLGQSSDENLPNYNPQGILLEPGFIELVKEDDALALRNPENINKIKLYTWRGHDEITNTNTDEAGVGWILAENWWPYQRPSFVTPPFAGFVSGHSTFSRAAAEVLTLFTGDAFFPGGMAEFTAKKNEFLVFEQGPSVDVKLQWATYRDASDQCSLSRIWGGIHPPADDIPGRLIGEKVGVQAFNFALPYFDKNVLVLDDNFIDLVSKVFPNPANKQQELVVTNTSNEDKFYLVDVSGRVVNIQQNFIVMNNQTKINLSKIASGIYMLTNAKGKSFKIIVQ